MTGSLTDLAQDMDVRRVLLLDGSRPLDRALVGGKAWSVDRMRALDIPVPPALVVTTEAWREYRSAGHLVETRWAELLAAVGSIERLLDRRLGDPVRPLLVSVRSGAAESMPGMMDTILNLGMNASVEMALAHETGDAAFARDTHRRFVEQFTAIVGQEPPEDPHAQLRMAVVAVFDSWESPRAIAYRRHRALGEDSGTAVTVQAMVFGNRDDRSGTGVLFSRNPLTGASEPYGEWLPRAQGEDVVSGRATPLSLPALADAMPSVHAELLAAATRIEADRRDMQDIEFTVESGKLWLLQSRNAKRSADAAIRIAVTLCREGLIHEAEAVARVSVGQAREALRPRLDPAAVAGATLLASGEPACPGFATGVAVDDADEALIRGEEGEEIILVRETTSPEDIHGMIAARGIITATGGSTSHAAVVSRELGRPCVVGCGAGSLATLAGGDITIDGAAGHIYAGRLPIMAPDERADPWIGALSEWAAALAPVTIMLPDDPPPAGDTPVTVSNEAGLHQAIDKGAAAVRVAQRLPMLLAAIRHSQDKQA